MSTLKFRKEGNQYKVSITNPGKRRDATGRTREDAMYYNVIDNDPNKIAQILLDLEVVDNFKIFEAVKIYLKRREAKDWLGF